MYVPRGVPSALVHLVCRFPLLVVPIAIGIAIALPCLKNLSVCPPQAMITFAFDDGYLSTYTKAFPILQKYGYPGTVFVVTSYINQPGYLDAFQILELSKNGWEIASHSVTHSDLTQLSDAQLDYELRVSKEYLENLGLKVESFACPYGKYDERTIKAISHYYFSHRTSWQGLNDFPLQKPEDRYYLKAVEVTLNTTVEEIKSWIMKARKEQKWLILVFHQIDGTGEYNWSSENLKEVVEFAFTQGFRGVKLAS